MSLWTRAGCVLALSLVTLPALADDAPKHIRIDAVKATTAPKLDGLLDDECWKDLPEYTSFTDSETGALTKCQTTAKICYDANYIYVAFHALYPDPSHTKAQETKRNGSALRRDDFVAVNIDSLHAHRDQSWFDVNPIGTQAEKLQRSSSENIEYKGDWLAAAKIVEDGYNVEIAIPFSLLVYSDRQDTFGISFRRNLPDENIWSVWPDLNKTDDLAYYADWKGLHLPQTGLRPKILTYLMGTRGTDEGRANYQGLDLKYPFSSSSLAVISLNPDFNNVEQQVESVDFSYTERMLSDARPFFSEWEVPVDSRIFYSRRIQDFDTGIKYASSSGAHTFGFMNMRTPGEQNDTVVSICRNLGNKSSISFCSADHKTPGHRNLATVGYGDLVWTNGQRTNKINGGMFSCDTTGLPDGHVRWINFSSNGAPGAINYYYDYGVVDKEWNGELGYTNDANTKGNYWGFWRETANRGTNFQGIFTGIDFYDRDRIDGTHFRKRLIATTDLAYVDGHLLHFSYMRQRYEQFEERVPSIEAYWNRNAMNRDGGAGVSWGDKAGGDYLLTWAYQKFRIGKKAALGIEWNRERIGETSPYAGTRRQTVLTANYDLSNERSLGGRVVAQQGERNVYFMYRQQVRNGTDAYLIYGDPNALSTDSMMTMKLVRVL